MLEDQRKAPSVKDVRKIEDEKIAMENKKREEALQKQKEKTEKQDNENAKKVIDKLEEMFEEGLVSSKDGCSIGVCEETCSEIVLEKVNKYLGGEWIAVHKVNSGRILVTPAK